MLKLDQIIHQTSICLLQMFKTWLIQKLLITIDMRNLVPKRLKIYASQTLLLIRERYLLLEEKWTIQQLWAVPKQLYSLWLILQPKTRGLIQRTKLPLKREPKLGLKAWQRSIKVCLNSSKHKWAGRKSSIQLSLKLLCFKATWLRWFLLKTHYWKRESHIPQPSICSLMLLHQMLKLQNQLQRLPNINLTSLHINRNLKVKSTV